MKILITGISGHLGRNCADLFEESGYEISGISKGDHSDMNNCKYSKSVDICDVRQLNALVEEPDVVLHLAGRLRRTDTPSDIILSNVLGTINVARRFPNSRLIHASSMSVCSSKQTVYSISKLLSERAIEVLHNDYVILRPTYLYGHYDSNSRIAKIIQDLSSGAIPTIGNGFESRDYLFCRDAAEAILEIVKNENIHNCTIDLGTGLAYSMYDIYSRIRSIWGSCPDPVSEDDEPSTPWITDTAMAKRLLRWRPKYDIDRGIRAMIEEAR